MKKSTSKPCKYMPIEVAFHIFVSCPGYHDPRFWEALGYLLLSFAFYAGAQLPVLRYRTWATVL
jgi:hypothetical protein